ncbi:TPA: phosphodiester glycosidase family protein [Escherichia coli]
MTTYNTGNPLGSAAAKDLYDNAQNFDHLSNDKENESWKDRFGIERLTWHGMENRYQEKLSSMGWNLMDSFQEGNTLTEADQALRWKLPDGDGEYYRWDGTLPKTVPAGSTPASTGGVGVGAWVSVGDSSLRGMLSNPEYGDALIAVKQDLTGAIQRSQHDKNSDNLDLLDFGVDISGQSDVGASLQNLADVFYATNKTLRLRGELKITTNIDFRCRVVFEPGCKIIGVKLETGPQTYINMYDCLLEVNNVTLDGIVMCFYPSNTYTLERDKRCLIFSNNILNDSAVQFGASNISLRNIIIKNNTFKNSGSRVATAIRLTNTSNIIIDGNLIQEYGRPIYLTATRSFSNYNIQISNNNMVCDRGIYLSGTSAFRVSKLSITGNDIVCENRNTAADGYNGIDLSYGTSVKISNNNIRTNGRGLNITNSMVDVSENYLIASATSNFVAFFASCYETSIFNNHIYSSSTSDIIIIHVQTESAGLYRSNNIKIHGNSIKGFGRLIRILDTIGYEVINNTLIRTSNNGNALIIADGSSDNGHVYGNVGVGVSGIIMSSLSGSSNVTVPADTLIVKPAFTKTVTPISNGIEDAVLNGSKAFIFSINVSDVYQIRALSTTGSGNAKTVSQFMTGISGAVLAWNGSAYLSEVDGTPDIFVNGVLQDSYGSEDYAFFRSGMVIDTQNKLSVRYFQCTGDGDTSNDGTGHMTLRNMGAAQAAEGAVHSAFFRSPLVMNGNIYNPDSTGIYPLSAFNTALDPRMAIGQKADGTYIVICVNGRNADGVSPGCTMQQLANKFVSLGCINAMNLDGGGSATLWYNGVVINSPSDGAERPIYHTMYV